MHNISRTVTFQYGRSSCCSCFYFYFILFDVSLIIIIFTFTAPGVQSSDSSDFNEINANVVFP